MFGSPIVFLTHDECRAIRDLLTISGQAKPSVDAFMAGLYRNGLAQGPDVSIMTAIDQLLHVFGPNVA